MGCGKSKESVATENTITVKKFNSKESKDIETVIGAEEEKNFKVKDITEDNELKKNNDNEEEIVPKELQINKNYEETVISKESPKKDEDMEFFSPHVGAGKETLFTNSVKQNHDDHHQAMEETPIKKEEDMAKETVKETSLESEVSSSQEETKQKVEEDKVTVEGSEGNVKERSE